MYLVVKLISLLHLGHWDFFLHFGEGPSTWEFFQHYEEPKSIIFFLHYSHSLLWGLLNTVWIRLSAYYCVCLYHSPLIHWKAKEMQQRARRFSSNKTHFMKWCFTCLHEKFAHVWLTKTTNFITPFCNTLCFKRHKTVHYNVDTAVSAYRYNWSFYWITNDGRRKRKKKLHKACTVLSSKKVVWQLKW